MRNRFGTSSDMIIQTVEEAGQTYFLAIDGKGLYLTTKERLDNHLADPNRFSSLRGKTQERLGALGLDPAGLLSSNKHLIKLDSGEPSKRVNPLKASKRKMKGN